MKVILEPKVTVVGKSVFEPHPEYEIPDDGTDADKLCAFAAKGCYDSYGKNGRSNVDNQIAVLESQHGSVLEHYHISFFFEGITRALSLELNRHRPFNISQRSTRYTKEEDSAIVLDPYYAKLFRKYNPVFNPNISRQWFITGKAPWDDHGSSPTLEEQMLLNFLNANEAAIAEYAEQVDRLIQLNPYNLTGFDLRKWARGKARNLLPHGLETRGVWTNNIRGLRWFIELRSERHAEPEIRVLANKIYEECIKIAPTHFGDFKVSGEFMGIPELVPTYRKV